jgi:carboxypeptidase C (cathepsin A)
MAEENASETPTGQTHTKIQDAFMSVPADAVTTTPEPASADLTWRGSKETEGEEIDYRCTAAHLDVRSDTGKLVGKMFSLTYVALGEDGSASSSRPVTFCYNGGPGCASVPINFGGVGPRRVKTDGVSHLAYPIEVEDNPYTLLRESDLVFLDALGTGFSSLAADADTKKVFGTDGDADAFCRAITTWLEENGRWGSPVYLFGESYGTVRNAILMRLLGERDVKVAGVTMLSAIFDWVQVLEGEDLYHLGMTPVYAATAHYFGKVGAGEDPNRWYNRALKFTEDTLAPALLKGDRLSREREADIAWQYSELIGLPTKHIQRCHLRITLDDFRRNVLLDDGRVCGRLDTRFSSDAPSFAQNSSEWFAGEDAADDAVESSWTTAFRSFLRDELGYHAPARYISSNYEQVGVNWNWEHREPGRMEASSCSNFATDIACAMRRNPHMKVAILGGRYDAATPYWNVMHDMSCQFLSDELKERLEWHRYGCGHMAYVDVPTLAQMSKDMEGFYGRE